MGMSDSQYKGFLLDQLADWQRVLNLAIEAKDIKVQKEVEMLIARINEKLKI